jgi:hypothetical protein
MKLCMYWAVPLPIIRSLFTVHSALVCHTGLYTGSGCSILTLLGSCHQTCKKYTNAECTTENWWWWAKEMPEKCKVFWQNKILEIRVSENKFITLHGHINVKIVKTMCGSDKPHPYPERSSTRLITSGHWEDGFIEIPKHAARLVRSTNKSCLTEWRVLFDAV